MWASVRCSSALAQTARRESSLNITLWIPAHALQQSILLKRASQLLQRLAWCQQVYTAVAYDAFSNECFTVFAAYCWAASSQYERTQQCNAWWLLCDEYTGWL